MRDEQGELFRNPLREEFERFHEEHPDVWELFERLAFELIHAGRRLYSARTILHRIRWHFDTSSRSEVPKINDHHSPFYARMFVERHPEHQNFFEFRRSAADVA